MPNLAKSAQAKFGRVVVDRNSTKASSIDFHFGLTQSTSTPSEGWLSQSRPKVEPSQPGLKVE